MKQNNTVVKKFENSLTASKEVEEKRSIMLNNVGLNNGLSKMEVLAVFWVLQEMMDNSVIICLLINFMLDVLCDSDTPGDMFPR